VCTIVDAMSSFGALPLRVGPEGVDAVVSCANKCLQGIAGVALVVARRAVFDEARRLRPRSHYFDLVAELDHLERTGQARFTLPPQVVCALRQALLELEQEGIEGRRQRYQRSFLALEGGLREMGFEMLLAREQQSRILLAVREPEASWYDFRSMHDELYALGFTVYPGKTGRTPCFRLSVLGDIDVTDIEAFLAALRRHVEKRRATASRPA